MSRDHVVLPKSSLLRFSVSGKIHYLSLIDNVIKTAFAKTFNTKENYYPTNTEQFLSKDIETTMGRLAKSLDDFVSSKGQFVFEDSIRDDLIRCMAVQTLRIPDTIKHIRSQSLFGQFFKLPDAFYSPLHRDGDKIVQMAIDAFERILINHEVNMCIIDRECCASSFILPTSHYLGIGTNILFILSPFHAFVLLTKEDNEMYKDDSGAQRYFTIRSDEELIPICKKAVEDESKLESKRIIGLRDQLGKIQNLIKSRSIEA